MPTRLTDTQVRNAKPGDKALKLTDGHGLFLLVHPNGSKYWRYRYRIAGAENLFAIGVYPEIGLQQARAAREAARKLVKAGIHPAQDRKANIARLAARTINTFEVLAREWIAANREHWTPYYLRQVEGILAADVFPAIGTVPPGDVTSHQILQIVRTIGDRGATSVATLVRQWCSAIFRFGIANLWCGSDPAEAVKGAVKRAKVRHKRALPLSELRELLSDIDSGEPSLARIALKLLMLTFVRPGELRGATWDEFDLPAQVWRIPAGRMKMREEHIVPISRQAMELLRELRGLTFKSESSQLFPNVRRPGEVMSATTLNRLLERMGWSGRFSAHGFRATASTLLNERGYRPEVIERQLAHRERNKVRASYNHASYFAERRQMMQEWADAILSEVGNHRVPNTGSLAEQLRQS